MIARSPARDDAGNLTEAAIRGTTFFMGGDRTNKRADSDCARCHVPETAFSDRRFHDVGVRPGAEQELNAGGRACQWCVNTPTLIGNWFKTHFDGGAGFAGTSIGLIQNMASRAGTVHEDGSIDLRDRNFAANVESETLLAIHHPSSEGRSGCKVTGEEIPVAPPTEAAQ